VKHDATVGQAPGDGRRLGRDDAGAAGMDGASWGLSGAERAALGVAWLCGLAIAATITVFDILTRIHDHPERSAAAAVIDEVSSALVTLVVLALPAAMAIWIRRTAPSVRRSLAGHALAAALYPVLHVAGFVGLRTLAYGLFLGTPYQFGRTLPEFLYEAAKDVPAYILSAAGFWLILTWRVPAERPVADAPGPSWFDIRDGARLVRTPVAEILAVRSAGNYAEFLLSDGRRPLMRTSLGGLEAALGRQGFLRTHRSWLVNRARVTGLRPEGSGDYAIELGAVEAPLSRRFREALTVLRG